MLLTLNFDIQPPYLGRNCPTHTGSRHVVPGCPLHHYFPHDNEIVSFDRDVQRQASSTIQRQAPSTTYVEVSSPEESPTATPLILTAPTTPESTGTPTRRAESPFSWEALFARSRQRRVCGWEEDSDSSSEAPPEDLNAPYTTSQSPPPSPTESEFDWPTRPSAREISSPTFDDIDIDIDDFDPEDYAGFDYERPMLWVPGWFKPSDDLQATHWYNIADAREAEAWAAIELDAALERVTVTAAILATAQTAAEEADCEVYNATLCVTVAETFMRSPEHFNMLYEALDTAIYKAKVAADALETAAAEAAGARAAARSAGANIDNDSGSDMDAESKFNSGLPWSSGDSIVNQLDTLGETQDDYEEH